MITDGMLVLWITINPADLQYPLVIRLTGVILDLGNNTQSAFARRTAKMNSIAGVKFFHIIYDMVFISLLAASQFEGGLLGLISNDFVTVETNGRGILYLYYLVWLRDISYLVRLCFQIQDNNEFCEKFPLFLEYIIKCSTCQDLHSASLHLGCADANNSIITLLFAGLPRSYSKGVACKI